MSLPTKLSLLLLFLLSNFSLTTNAQSTSDSAQELATIKTGNFVGIERAFSRLRFDRPVALTGAGDGSGRIFVVEQAGVVRWFQTRDESPTNNVFLDISKWVSRRGNEEGLIGFAFHPQFSKNGYVFCHYSSERDRVGKKGIAPNIVSRFRVAADGNSVDLASEKILMKIPQPYNNHNGGAMLFGKDGYLYLSLGDGGFRDDPQGNGQKLTSLLGSILRIDIDNTSADLPYAIPEDNPFIDRDDARGEIFALGLRNVWRFSFDRKTGELWAADVGQNRIEEVNIIEKGGNYGWNRYEANDDFKQDTELAIEGHAKPVAHYGHEWGGSITGGYVYRGKRFPQLDGGYFFGDYMTGNLWRTVKTESGEYQTELVRRTGRSIASFGEDDDGELFLLSFDGGIYRIVPTAKPENTFKDWPEKLSETGLFASMENKFTGDHLIPYEVNAPFWSDKAEKSRYFILPEGKQLGYRGQGTWEVPVGATIVKNFRVQFGRKMKMFETRLIKRTSDGWAAATYVWDKQEKDATLLPDGKQFEYWDFGGVHSWHAPSASECAKCHVDAAGFVLGMTTAQLNRPAGEEGENQILKWAKSGYVSLPAELDLASAPRFCSPMDKSVDLETRARVWMDVNCAMCHQPNGPGNANIDLRYTTSLDKSKIIGVPPTQGHLNIPNAQLVAPGNPEQSLMLFRIQTLGEGRMPSVGSNQVDKEGAKLMADWIRSLKPEQ